MGEASVDVDHACHAKANVAGTTKVLSKPSRLMLGTLWLKLGGTAFKITFPLQPASAVEYFTCQRHNMIQPKSRRGIVTSFDRFILHHENIENRKYQCCCTVVNVAGSFVAIS